MHKQGEKFQKKTTQLKNERINLFFVDQATPRFELGKEDLQSPALPLGHVAKIFIKYFFWIFVFVVPK